MSHRMTRRSFTALAAASLALAPARPRPSQAQPHRTRAHVIDMGNAPFFDRDAPPRGLDGDNACTRPNTGFFEALENAGIDTVFRYYSDKNNANLNCKNVTRRERDILHDHGVSLAIVYQFEGRAKNRYAGARADADARFCLERARVIGQPEGSAIYFGVDSDAALNSDQDVLAYFETVNALFDGRYRVGVYAAGARCRLLRDAGLATFFWVPEAPAWAGTRAFLNSGDWTLYQNKTNIDKNATTSGLGQPIAIDTNILNPAARPTLGAFQRDGSIKTYDQARLQAVAQARFWVKDGKLDVYYEPNGAVVGHLCIARTVHVLDMHGDWAMIDVDEDGTIDGFCRRSGLAPLSDMPVWRRADCRPQDI